MVEITSFRPVGGDLGIEFLNYQQPVGGRNRLDTQITDLCDKKILIESSSMLLLCWVIRDRTKEKKLRSEV